MSTQNSRSFPIRMPAELMEEIEAATEMTGLSQQDVMRLAMRIGLVDLRAANNIASIVQEAATDKGTSFLSWARQQRVDVAEKTTTPQPIPHVSAAASSNIPATAPPPDKPTAKLAKFPRPIMPESELRVAEPATAYKFTDRTKKKGA